MRDDVYRRLRGVVPTAGAGWATRTLDRTVRLVILVGAAALAFLTAIVACVASGHARPIAVTALFYLGLTGLSLLAIGRRIPVELVVIGNWAVGLWVWGVVPDTASPLLFAAVWIGNLTPALCALLIPGWRGVVLPVVALVVVAPTMVWIAPERPWAEIPLSVLVTGLAITVVVRVGFSVLQDFVADADRAARDAEIAEGALAEEAVASRGAVEVARVLHDGVINTLAAVASAGAVMTDTALVQERCRRDAETITSILDGTVVPGEAWADGLDTLAVGGGRVRHTGLASNDVDSVLDNAPMAAARALRGVTGEAVRNALKHSGADEVVVDVERDEDSLRVTVRDQGEGFDGHPVRGHGLAESMIARAEAAGLDLAVDTVPSRGTTVQITLRLEPDRVADADLIGTVRSIRERAALLWAGGLSVVGLVLAIGNHHGRLTTEFLMVLLDALAFAVAWWSVRRGRTQLAPAAALILIAAAVGAFVAAGAGVDFGRADPILWQALGFTGPLVLLIAFAPRWFFFAMALTIGSVAVTITTVALDPPAAALICAMAAVIGFGFTVGWYGFHSVLGRIGERVIADERRRNQIATTLIAARATETVRRRWRDAGLRRARDLLDGIAAGRDDPAQSTVQRAAAEEERYLRELIGIDPDLVHLGYWLTRAHAVARERGVELVVRSGGSDLPAQPAQDVGGFVVDVITAMHSGTRIVVTVFDTGAGTRISVVAPRGCIGQPTDRAVLWPTGVSATYRAVGEQEMVELLYRTPADEVVAW